jgi:hypothetical protein
MSAADDIRSTWMQLKPLRPPTAPAEDLEKERRAIAFDVRRSVLFIQVALGLIVLALVAYLVLPASWANGLAFLLLCVGVAVGFFLRE